MATDEVPEPWASAMRRANLGNPRNGRPSWRALAAAVDRHPSTITAMVQGSRKRNPELVADVAAALRVSAGQVSQWLDLAVEVGGPYEPPASSRYLTDPERDAIDQLIKAITVDREDGGEHERSAPIVNGPRYGIEGPEPPRLAIAADDPGTESDGSRQRRQQDEDAER